MIYTTKKNTHNLNRLSATDPVAVVALLKELGVDERLGTLIEGESLMNDGTAIVVFNVMLRALTNESCCDAVDVLAWTCRLSFGGPLLGLIIGNDKKKRTNVHICSLSNSGIYIQKEF